ncbi:MAG: agmatine deiminase family protein [Phycisphaeraceae bacterium]
MTHPRIAETDRLILPESSAAQLGYRMPAEFEPLSCIWLALPFNPETWPGCLDDAQKQFADWVDVMRQAVPVSTTDELGIETNDSWIRDFGPIFVVNRDKSASAPLACHDFHFNTWGGKYEVRDRDDVVPQQIARQLGLPIWIHDFVLEGGSIDVNGQGTVMTTEQCLLNPNRNPALSRSEIEAKLHETLGTRHVIWLPGGIEGDDTDGHIDDVARFIAPATVVAVSAPPDHPDHAMTQRNLAALRSAVDQDGRPLRVIELPVPNPIFYDYPEGRSPVPASYANFVIANGHVFVPTFDQPADDRALAVLSGAMPGYSVIPVPAHWLVVGLGALHCLSQQQPAPDS